MPKRFMRPPSTPEKPMKAGEDGQRHTEADGGGEGIDHGLQQVVILLDAEDGDAEQGTVGRDEGQEDAQVFSFVAGLNS